MYLSQWSRLLKNKGIWKGSFSQFSPQGELRQDTPTQLVLESFNEEKTIKLTVNRLDGSQPPTINEFTSLNRNIFLFEDGHFAKGSQQYSPFSLFGAEYGFFDGDRRCRLVQVFDKESALQSVTLIREFRENGNGRERPMLCLSQLIGEWEGEALTLYPDWRNTQPYKTNLKIELKNNTLYQKIQTPEFSLTSQGIIEGNIVNFNQNNQDYRLLLLPDGASSLTPLKIRNRQSFLLEFAWLMKPNLRLRLMRQYDDEGRWINITLIKEYRL